MDMFLIFIFSCIVLVQAVPGREEKDQYCTDPRTLRRHAAYTEWADAYSCSRHRCQPGGRNLAIYTVGCKRVEAPESAIECEEVVEDTNMQFPYCCIRLRCLVVVRGEVWTRVLGQPWETLPAAPWSHMYKMKKPPPIDGNFQKSVVGPVYELFDANEKSKSEKEPTLRSKTEEPASPDIVIALSTGNNKKTNDNDLVRKRYNVVNKSHGGNYERDSSDQRNEIEDEDGPLYPDKDANSNESYSKESKSFRSHKDSVTYPEASASEDEKPGSLQTLVDAIGTRMRDIENVVQRMSEQVAPEDVQESVRPRARDVLEDQDPKILEDEVLGKMKSDLRKNNNRLPHSQGSRYLRDESTTEPPQVVEDPNLHGYFSDPSNLVRRSNKQKMRANTYTVPVDTTRKRNILNPENPSIKYRKHSHKKKKSKRGKKKHRRDEEGKRVKIYPSFEKIGASLEDSNDIGKL